MAFSRFTEDAEVISALDDKPNITDGLTPAALKAKFDKIGADLKDYLNNTLCDELETGGAGNIGIDTISGLEAANIQDALEELKAAIDDATTGSLPAGSVTTAKLADLAVTTAKISELAVTTAKLNDLAVTAGKLAAGAVETAKLADGAVTEGKLAAASVTNAKLGDGAVGTDNLKSDLLVPVTKGGTGAATAAAARTALGAQREIHVVKETLTVAGLTNKSQSLTITGMTAGSEFVASPSTAAGWEAAADAMLFPPTAGENTLTFTCKEVPAADIPVTVYWW